MITSEKSWRRLVERVQSWFQSFSETVVLNNGVLICHHSSGQQHPPPIWDLRTNPQPPGGVRYIDCHSVQSRTNAAVTARDFSLTLWSQNAERRSRNKSLDRFSHRVRVKQCHHNNDAQLTTVSATSFSLNLISYLSRTEENTCWFGKFLSQFIFLHFFFHHLVQWAQRCVWRSVSCSPCPLPL